jgi:hypothetical protein
MVTDLSNHRLLPLPNLNRNEPGNGLKKSEWRGVRSTQQVFLGILRFIVLETKRNH